jgi:hypothetical protein
MSDNTLAFNMYVISTNYKAEKKRLLVWSPWIHSVSVSLELKKETLCVANLNAPKNIHVNTRHANQKDCKGKNGFMNNDDKKLH